MRTFATPAPITATVDVVFGDIQFTATDRADTVVEVRPADPARDLDIKAAAQTVVDYAAGTLTIKQPKMRTLWTTKYGIVTVHVRLPTGSNVHGHTAKGAYRVEGMVGTCQLTNTAGNIHVQHATGVRLRTTGGTVTVDHVTGPADVHGNGEIRIRQIDGSGVVKNIGGHSWVGHITGDLRAKSATGDITIDSANAGVTAQAATGNIRLGQAGSGEVDLSTAIGEVAIGIPQGTMPRLDAHTSMGRVRNTLNATGTGRTVAVRARTHGGDIIVHPA